MTVGEVAGTRAGGAAQRSAPWRTAGYAAVATALGASALAQAWSRPLLLAALTVLVPLGWWGILGRRERPWLLPAVGCLDALLGLNVFLGLGLFSLLLRRRDATALTLVGLGTVATTLSAVSRPVPSAPPLGASPGTIIWLTWGAAVLAQVVFPVLLGGWLGTQRELVANLRQRAAAAEAERRLRDREAVLQERERIAHEMHDALGHQLTLVAMHAGALSLTVDAEPAAVARQAEVIRSTARAALVDLRQVVGALQPESDGLHPSTGLAAVRALVARSREVADLEVTDDLAGRPVEPPDAVCRAVFRIVQEGLTNAHRHAPGGRIRLSLGGAPGTGVDVTVTNELSGPGLPAGNGTGLAALAERVRLLGGSLQATRHEDRFELVARLPWPAAGEDAA